MNFHQYIDHAVRELPDKIAAEEVTGRSISYRDLGGLSDRLRDRLVQLGVRPGDRVGIWIRKSIDSLATIFGIPKAGAAYVPVDANAPAKRNSYILADCAVKVVIVESGFAQSLTTEFSELGLNPEIIVIRESGGGLCLRAWLDEADSRAKARPVETAQPEADDLAYILYTSGSTGKPKGVLLTHGNAVSYVEWCSETFAPKVNDRFSSHAPFHFDLSILDIYTPLKHAATVVLIGEEVGKQPFDLARLIADMKITVWYSAPSILSLMAQVGKLETHDYASLRLVLFAGEVFPITHLKSLTKQVSHPRYFNLYGPTETNVCTYYEVPLPIPADRSEPVPIGKICAHLEGVVIDPNGIPVNEGDEGELCIRGPAVTNGYWNLPDQSRNSFITVGSPPAYYRTGDIVVQETDGNYRYVGRRDRMIKKRGFRVELGEIEACLYRHSDIREAAVVAIQDDTLGMKVFAHIVCPEGKKPSLINLKTFCSKHVPVYMIPDVFSFHQTLPKTSTDKVDYQTLKAQSQA